MVQPRAFYAADQDNDAYISQSELNKFLVDCSSSAPEHSTACSSYKCGDLYNTTMTISTSSRRLKEEQGEEGGSRRRRRRRRSEAECGSVCIGMFEAIDTSPADNQITKQEFVEKCA